MEKYLDYIATLPPAYSFLAAFPIAFAGLWLKSKTFQNLILGFFPKNKEKRMIKVLDLVLQEGFESFHKMNFLEFIDLRNNRKQIIEEASLAIYLKVCRLFDEEIGFETCEQNSFSVPNEKKFFENSSRMLLNICAQKFNLYFEERGVRFLNDQDFRAWIDTKFNYLKNDMEREFYNSYPDIGLNVPRHQIEELIRSQKSEFRDCFFNAAFRLRDLEKTILNEIEEERKKFNIKKTKLFSDFLNT